MTTPVANDAVHHMVLVTVAEAEVELASDVLFALGARAIEERASGAGRVGLVCSLGQTEAVLADALAALSERWETGLEEVDPAVSMTWREHASPIHVDERLTIVPDWVFSVPDHVGRRIVRIDPGFAFGMGDHPTTRLSTTAVLDLAQPGATMLDMGCGSGLLAIVGALLGASDVMAVDIDAEAVEATVMNAERNGVAGTIEVVHSSEVPQPDVPFDLICANILAPVLVRLAPDLVDRLAVDGRLVLSGLLADRAAETIAAYLAYGLTVDEVRELDGWTMVIMSRS